MTNTIGVTVFREPRPCPTCGYNLDATSTLVDDAKPEKGDLTVCAKCGTVLQFGENLSLVRMSQEELDKLEPETKADLELYLKAWRDAHVEKPE